MGKNVLALLVAGLISLAGTCFAGDGATVPLNFDTQLIHIFEAAQTAPEISPDHAVTADERQVLKRILDKFNHHQMMLKNSVYRPDMGVIRITWADDSDYDVVKASYKTGKDVILRNSVYANKKQVVDVNIMYRKPDGGYDYLNLQNMQNANSPSPSHDEAAAIKDSVVDYRIEGKQATEKCRSCHVLAQKDGSPSGMFFPRYQETDKDRSIGPDNSLFHMGDFSLTVMPAESAKKLGLAPMTQEFVYRKVSIGKNYAPDEESRFAHTLIDSPQLIEVMARDNMKSICVAIDFGSSADKASSGKNDYVCADNAAQRLSVRLTGAMQTVDKKPVQYSEPYTEKK